MTDEKVVQLAEKYANKMYPDYSVTHYDACDQGHYGSTWEEKVDRSKQRAEAKLGLTEALGEAYDVGRRDGLEELAGNLWRYPGAPPIGKLRKGKRYDDRLYAIKKIRELASISSSANSVEGEGNEN